MLWGVYQSRRLRHSFKAVQSLTSRPVTTVGIPDPSAALSFSQGELLKHEHKRHVLG